MKKGLVVSDAGPIFSLAIADKLDILDELFSAVHIPGAVWTEVTRDQTTPHYDRIVKYFQNRKKEISGTNSLTFVMDYGESEAVILYTQLNADFLLIDDKKARAIAENLGIECIGTIGILSIARERGIISELKPIFDLFIKSKRFYSLNLLNTILRIHGEKALTY